MILYSLFKQACYINLAAKLTVSPITEYSRLDPDVPTTPANTVPVAIPTETEHFIWESSVSREKAVKTARIGSS